LEDSVETVPNSKTASAVDEKVRARRSLPPPATVAAASPLDIGWPGSQERSFTRHLKRKSSSLDESGIIHAGTMQPLLHTWRLGYRTCVWQTQSN
jgi:hypothetical protein